MDIGLAPHQHQWSAGAMVDNPLGGWSTAKCNQGYQFKQGDKERDLAKEGFTYDCVGP